MPIANQIPDRPSPGECSLQRDVGSAPAKHQTNSQLMLRAYTRNLWAADVVPFALRMALALGTLSFAINHGDALWRGTMTRDRWLSGVASFVTPYLVSVYGQTRCQLKVATVRIPHVSESQSLARKRLEMIRHD